jgi:uncharacterized protein (DUF58 family)
MSRPHVVAPSELSALRDLELVTRATVEGLRQGLHRSPFHGFSAEFSQYRHYRPGDDLKYVDWKAFGRTDRLYTRQFRETTNLSALFVLDVSGSMTFRGKFDLARAAAAVLGTLVLDQGDTAGLLAYGEPVRYLPPRSGRHHLRLFLAALGGLRPEGDVALSMALGRAATLVRRRGLIIVVSDFYDEEQSLAEVRRLAHMGHDVVVVHVLAKDEVDLGDLAAGELVDAETGARLVVDPRVAGPAYREQMKAFLTRVADASRREGLDYLRLVTGHSLESALRRFLVERRGSL